jgi:glutamate carboxypeptidase
MTAVSIAPRLLSWLQGQQTEMLPRLRGWVEQETPTAEPARVRALAEEVAAAFEHAGCRARLHDCALELDHPGGAAERPLLLLGHLDTVYPVGTLARTPWREDAGRIFAPGIYDMKAGVAMALHALQALAAIGTAPGRRLKLLFVFDEETGSRRSRPVTEAVARDCAAALVLEPGADADGKLKVARKGIGVYRLQAHGVAAHAGVDFEKGASAITELAGRIAEVAGWVDLDRGLTVNPGLISGGTGVNVVAAEAEAAVEARAWTVAEQQAFDARLRGLAARDGRVRLEISGGINRPPMEATPASLALAARAQAIAGELGFTPGTARTGGGSDGNFTAALGVPTLDGLGAVGGGAHSPGEHIVIAALAARTALLATLLTIA